ncbi:Rid family detoxifying hydrolase [Enterococcus hirae]|nr:Rid family detoxifying hydrolase [Enterococcus hirae]
MAKEYINAAKGPAAVGPYVHAVKCGNTLHISGQLGINPETGKLADGVEAQAHQAMKNLGVILNEAGMDYNDVVKTLIFLDDMGDFGKINDIYGSYFKQFPARSCIEVAALPMNGLFEVEAEAYKE